MNQSEAAIPKIIPEFQAANEAILRAARFVWHSLGSKSAASLNLPTEGHATSPASSVVDLNTNLEVDDVSSLGSSKEAKRQRDDGEDGAEACENGAVTDQKSKISKLLQEFVKIWGNVSIKASKNTQVLPLGASGDEAKKKLSRTSVLMTNPAAEVLHGWNNSSSLSMGQGSTQIALKS